MSHHANNLSYLTPDEAALQLKTKFSNFFQFFKTVPQNVTQSLDNVSHVISEKTPAEILQRLNPKPKISSSDLKPQPTSSDPQLSGRSQKSDEKAEKAQKVEKSATIPAQPTQNDNKKKPSNPKPAKSGVPKAIASKDSESKAPSRPQFNSFGDMLASIGNLMDKTAKGIEKSSQQVAEKLDGGIDFKSKLINGRKEGTNDGKTKRKDEKVNDDKRVESAPRYYNFRDMLNSFQRFVSKTKTGIQESSTQIGKKLDEGIDLRKLQGSANNSNPGNTAETISSTSTSTKKSNNANSKRTAEQDEKIRAEKKRLEEVKRLKQQYEEQLKNLDKEIRQLEDGQSRGGDSSRRSNQEIERKQKAFKISSQKSSEKLKELPPVKGVSNVKSAKGRVILPPLEESAGDNRKPPVPVMRKWQPPTSEQELKGGKPTTPLYLKMEREFIQKMVEPEIEARKEKLKVKKEAYRPMDERAIREHAVAYEEKRKNLINLHAEKIEKEIKEKNFKPIKTNAYVRVVEQEKEEKVKSELKNGEKKQLKDKQAHYSKLVKEMFAPKIDRNDPLYRENLQNLIEKAEMNENEEVEGVKPMVSTAKESKSTFDPIVRKKRASQDLAPLAMGNHHNQQKMSPGRGRYAGGGGKVKEMLLGAGLNYQQKSHSPSQVEEAYENWKKRKAAEKKAAEKRKNLTMGDNGEEGNNEEKDLKESSHLGSEHNSKEKDHNNREKEHKVRAKVSLDSNKGKQRLNFGGSPLKGEKGVDEVKMEEEGEEAHNAKKNYPNYLVEVRQKRIEQEKKTGKGKYGNWEKVLKNKELSHQEKVMNILDNINKIESQAKLKESKLRLRQGSEPTELEEDVGEMYLESIKAKLAIIHDLA